MHLLGDAPPIEADECFSETWDHLSQMLTQQAVVYEEEEHALRVLMEAEVMEAMASSKSGTWRLGGGEGKYAYYYHSSSLFSCTNLTINPYHSLTILHTSPITSPTSLTH